MKILYTAQPIEGMVESPHPTVATRVAREKLEATIQEYLVRTGLVKSYTIADDDKFPFPFDMPNIMKMNGFFGKKPDYNLVEKEVKKLFESPKKELEEFEAKLKHDLEIASDEKIVEMVERFHYTPQGTKGKHADALAKVKKLWKPYKKMKKEVETPDYSGKRKELLEALEVLDDCHVRSLLGDISKTEKLLKAGKRDEAKKEVLSNYQNWERSNLVRLYNVCGDARFYGGGFWIARLVVPDGEAKVEEVLETIEMPYQVVVV